MSPAFLVRPMDEAGVTGVAERFVPSFNSMDNVLEPENDSGVLTSSE